MLKSVTTVTQVIECVPKKFARILKDINFPWPSTAITSRDF
jgi:hypothetical protein